MNPCALLGAYNFDHRFIMLSPRCLLACVFMGLCAPLWSQIAIDVTVDVAAPCTPISPLVFGFNHDLAGWQKATFRRWGGNSTETYNWVNNCSNSGNDYLQANSRWLARHMPVARCAEPAAVISAFHEESLQRGVPSMVNLPLIGYVAADDLGPVLPGEAAPSRRWKRVAIEKGAPLSDRPDPALDTVYLDEEVSYLTHKFGPASGPTGIRFWSLGNEPGLWVETHPLAQREPVKCREYVERAIATARMVKRIDPTAQVVGFTGFGIAEYARFHRAPDWEELRRAHGYHWFIDYFLDEFARASAADGRRLLDVLTLNFYGETELEKHGGLLGVMQSPRTLWEPGFREASWVGEVMADFTPILPRVRDSVARYYPGTKVGFTEYDFALPDAYAGGVAIAETLGVFIDQEVFLAAAWPRVGADLRTQEPARYAVAAHKLYRNFDGRGGTFGDLRLAATNTDSGTLGVHASMDSRTGCVHLILVGKALHATSNITVTLKNAGSAFHSVRAWGFDADSPELCEASSVAEISGNRFVYTLPRQTTLHLVISPEAVATGKQ